MSTCFFIGHGDASRRVFPSLLESMERHIVNYGVSEFIVGHYGAFDSMAAAAVYDLKNRYADVKQTLLLPYHSTNRKEEYTNALFDDTLYPFDAPVPPRYAIIKANEYVISRVDYLICYVNHVGKSRDFLQYVQRRAANGSLRIENLADSLRAGGTL